jgi:hypothetical protein
MNEPLRSDFATRRQRIIDGSKQLDKGLTDVKQIQDQIRERTRQAETSHTQFHKAFASLVNKTAAVCHELVITRSHDEWSLAFSYLANSTLATLGQARQAGDDRVANAMLFNLSRMSGEMVKSFSESALVMDAWQRAVQSLGVANEPDADPKPHPFADSLSQLVLLLRDTGPKIGLREIYAVSENGLHVIRPA